VTGDNPSFWRGDDLPVESVSWDECVAFCGRLGEGFRLPTEAEWEHACRAGTTTPFFFGETISTDLANYDGGYPYGVGRTGVRRHKTTPVGSFPPNAWGLFDMHGNVWEWCLDWYGRLPTGDQTDPKGGDGGNGRVLRGGSWQRDPRDCRSDARHCYVPRDRNESRGCRVLLSPD
jgi:formylglycine-generating enzyme required for sulfatase activity